MKLHRLQVKAYVDGQEEIDLSALIPVFHRWIQDGALEELLIDVANYEHVPEGPGIVLIGHEADYALDLGGGRPGLLYTRKRAVPDGVGAALKLALHRVFAAAHLLERDESTANVFKFRTDELEFGFLDRLQVPSVASSLELVRDDLVNVVGDVYDTDDVMVEWIESDDRLPFRVRVRTGTAPSISELAERGAIAQPL